MDSEGTHISINLKLRLLADFGIDVLIEGGRGSRADPYVISPCLADMATQTQLDLLRGLGKGRQELWRLTDAEMVPEAKASIQVINLEAFSLTQHEAVTEFRSCYFDVSKVAGFPCPDNPGEAWLDLLTMFSAPYQIGWMHFENMINNGGKSRRDMTLVYDAFGARAALHLYEARSDKASKPCSSDGRIYELGVVCDQIRRQYSEAETLGPPILAEPFILRSFSINDKLSIVGIAVITDPFEQDHFVKFRLTFHDSFEMREKMRDTLDELRNLVNSASNALL